jgi:predicted phosphohydrolase
MLIHYISDLHLERIALNATCLVRTQKRRIQRALFVAGDLGHPHQNNYKSFLYQACDLWDTVYYVPGNHDYDMAQSTLGMKDMDNYIDNLSMRRHNLYILRAGRQFELGNFNVTGCTLWRPTNMHPFWKSDEYNHRHATDSRILHQTIEASTKPLIVMTHYPPSPPAHPFLLQPPVKYWIAGHTHTVLDRTVKTGDTTSVRMLINADPKNPRIEAFHA